MIDLQRTDANHEDFISLVKLLDAELALRDGDEHAFYSQFNKIGKLKFVVVAYVNGQAAGCGAFREYEPNIAEIKRMFVPSSFRGKGIAKAMLIELEGWAASIGYHACVLETGKKQPEAIALYHKQGYQYIPCYGQYLNVENSVCMKKQLVAVASL